MNISENGDNWYDYFHVRWDAMRLFYVAWRGTSEPVNGGTGFDEWYKAKRWIETTDWRSIVDEKFEKEFLEEK